MVNTVLLDDMVTEQAYDNIVEEIEHKFDEYRGLCRRVLGIYEKTIVKQEKYLFYQYPIVYSFYSEEELYLLMGENFEEATVSIRLTRDGYVVISENSKPMRYYQFQSTLGDDSLEISQTSVSQNIDEEINSLKEAVSLFEEHGVQMKIINDELMIRRLNNQMS